MLLLIGLGNPGPKYERNRHNIGFMAVDAIADAHRFGSERTKFQAHIREGAIETDNGPVKTLLMKPQTFMNESGRAAGEAARFFKIAPADICVFYDELDLAPGKFRLKTGGGAAGHNGVRSLISALGPDFKRARMGIGHPGSKDRVYSWVLSDFAKADQTWLEALCDACGRAAPLLAAGDDAAFQTKVTYLAPAPKAEKKDTPTADG